ncbi:hypothetical protein [uncultured Sunxiuqinia sp.]|nr:hypothetical protein [uncultured Sunxiuqinia sp.]
MPTTAPAETTPASCAGTSPPIKIEAISICVGQRPLHREKNVGDNGY